MLRFFSVSRNITGLVLLTGPVLSVLLTDRPAAFWLSFSAAMAISLPLLRCALQNLPFRPVLLLFTVLFLSGSYVSHSAGSALLMGCGASLLLLLPPVSMAGWHPQNWPRMLALSWSLSILAVPLIQHILLPLPVSAAAGIFFLKKPAENWKYRLCPPVLEQKSRYLKSSFFTAAVISSLLIALSMILSSGSPADLLSGTSAGFWFCLSAGPLLAWYFAEKKGVFSSCILLIFLCEMSMLFLGFFTGGRAFFAGRMTLLLAAGASAVILPLLAFYLYGRINYLQNLSRMLFSVPLGIFCGLPFLQMCQNGELKPDEAAIVLFFLLTMAFFCIFFAWKQRFIILKNKII